MKHSWSWKQRRDQCPYHSDNTPVTDPQPPLPSDVPPEMGDRSEASERLVAVVRSGIRNVLETVAEVEKAFKEERAELERRRASEPAQTDSHASRPSTPPQPRPSSPEPDHVPPSARLMTDKTAAPNRPNEPASLEPALSKILDALEKINAKLDDVKPSKPSNDDSSPRLV
ncbi:hypothetical protein FRB99_006803 [Tulasnella sp. 403]|nr:hypothetical protein FRB99_006803 [Tulasnella sp. 403]